MDVGEMMRLYVELGDPEMPIPRLRRVLEHLGLASAAGYDNVDGPRYYHTLIRRLLVPFGLLLCGANLMFLSWWVSCGPARRCRLVRAVARASVPPLLLLSLLLGACAIDRCN